MARRVLDQPPAALADAFRRTMADERVDVVLDYLWGPSAEAILGAASAHGAGEAARRVGQARELDAVEAPAFAAAREDRASACIHER